MDAFSPIRYDNPKASKCLPEFVIHGYCRELTPSDSKWSFRKYKNKTFDECQDGYYGEYHCSWSKFIFLFL